MDKPVSEPTAPAQIASAFGRPFTTEQLAKDYEEGEAARLQMAKDAARYRWLRENGSCNEKRGYGAVIDAYSNPSKRLIAFRYWCDADQLDAAIDAAMKG